MAYRPTPGFYWERLLDGNYINPSFRLFWTGQVPAPYPLLFNDISAAAIYSMFSFNMLIWFVTGIDAPEMTKVSHIWVFYKLFDC